MQEMSKFNFEIPEDLKLEFNIIALREKRSMAEITRDLIANYVKQESLKCKN